MEDLFVIGGISFSLGLIGLILKAPAVEVDIVLTLGGFAAMLFAFIKSHQ